VVNDFKNVFKKLNEIRKSIQDLEKKVSNMNEILKTNDEKVETKISIN
jgi:hypothetical protein